MDLSTTFVATQEFLIDLMPRPKKNKKIKIDPNLLVAIGVLLASFAALLIYTRQAQIMNKQTEILLEQTKASAWPHLTIQRLSNNALKGDGLFEIFIENKGTGPAIIEKVTVAFDGEAVSNWKEFYQQMNVPDSLLRSHSNENIRNQVLAANETLHFIKWESTATYNHRFLPLLKKVSDKISISICYQSVYGDKWVVRRDGFLTDLEPNERSKQEACANTDTKEFIQ